MTFVVDFNFRVNSKPSKYKFLLLGDTSVSGYEI